MNEGELHIAIEVLADISDFLSHLLEKRVLKRLEQESAAAVKIQPKAGKKADFGAAAAALGCEKADKSGEKAALGCEKEEKIPAKSGEKGGEKAEGCEKADKSGNLEMPEFIRLIECQKFFSEFTLGMIKHVREKNAYDFNDKCIVYVGKRPFINTKRFLEWKETVKGIYPKKIPPGGKPEG